MSHEYCPVCRGIKFDALPRFPDNCYQVPLAAPENLALFKSSKGPLPKPLGEAYYASYQAKEARTCYCVLCNFLHTALTSAQATFARLKDTSKFRKELTIHGSPEGPYFICARPNPGDGFVVVSSKADHDSFYVVAATIHALDVEQARIVKLARQFNARVRELYAMQQVRKIQDWTSECKAHHSHTHSTSDDFPARLIDVHADEESADVVRLVEPGENNKLEYVCLSHQWGLRPALRTTSATLNKRLAGIPLEDLPATFEDAIIITRELGYRYLWIDNLCIVQDSDEDKSKEIIKMAGIYENAQLTIAAACAEQDTEGFLNVRRLRRWSKVPGLKAFTLELSILVALNPVNYFKMPQEPLLSRAWALQERCLPIRMVHFGTDQVSWECPAVFKNEDAYALPNPAFKFRSNLPRSPGKDPYAEWRELVEDYTRRNLTKPSDKLPAVGALARIYEQRRLSGRVTCDPHWGVAWTPPSSYLAGVWKHDLPRELCWRSVWGYGNRAEPYRAPSWSWASVDAPITFIPDLGWRPLARVTGAYITRKDANIYGEVRAGWIELEGPLLRLKLRPLDNRRGVSWSLIDDVPLSVVEESWDCEGEEQYLKQHPANVSMLGLLDLADSSGDSGGQSGVVVLVLSRVPDAMRTANNLNADDEDSWSRVALLTVTGNSEVVRRLKEPERLRSFKMY